MIATIEINGNNTKIDLSKEIDISIPVRFDEQQFKAFGANAATSKYYGGDNFTISIESGAGCNCPVFTFSSHLHGTHTECVGHISKQDHIVQDVIQHAPYMSAQIITIEPSPALNCGENYTPDFNDGDMVITAKMLQQKLDENSDALIIRTAPNDADKLTRNYDEIPPAFFTNDAMQIITNSNIQHLLVDMPSVDRLQDDGCLSNHHIFWDVPQGSNDVPAPSSKSITEFIFIPDTVKDGAYILSLNIGNIRSDAAPSRPVLYEVLS